MTSIREQRRTPALPAPWLALAAEVLREPGDPAARAAAAKELAERVLAFSDTPDR